MYIINKAKFNRINKFNKIMNEYIKLYNNIEIFIEMNYINE